MNEKKKGVTNPSTAGKKRYFRFINEIEEPQQWIKKNENEFGEISPVDEILSKAYISRRDFLKLAGFGAGIAIATGCETPVEKIANFAKFPDYMPGKKVKIPTTFYDGYDYAPLIGNVLDGRPIFLSPNPDNSTGIKGLNARILASLLYCYDSHRLQGIKQDGMSVSYSSGYPSFIQKLKENLKSASASGKNNYLVTHTIISPTLRRLLQKFSEQYNVKILEYDSIPWGVIGKAYEIITGKDGIPLPRLDKANVVVGIDCDFLMTYPLSLKIAADYSRAKSLSWGEAMNQTRKFIKHYQIECVPTTTGLNADERIVIKPSERTLIIALLYNELLKRKPELPYPALDESALSVIPSDSPLRKSISKIAEELMHNYESSVVFSGSFNIYDQIITALINRICGAFNNTIDLNTRLEIFKGHREKVNEIFSQEKGENTGTLIFYNVNPAYDIPELNWQEFCAKAENSVYIGWQKNETTALCKSYAATTYIFEEWGDAEIIPRLYATIQPLLTPFFDVKSLHEILIDLLEIQSNPRQEVIKTIQENYGIKDDKEIFEIFKRGELNATESLTPSPLSIKINDAIWQELNNHIRTVAKEDKEWQISIVLHPHLIDGRHFENPFLRELPEPVTRITWDTFLTMNPVDMKELNLNILAGQKEKFNTIEVKLANDKTIEETAIPLPGQKRKTIVFYTGYGRKTERNGFVSEGVNLNTFMNQSYIPVLSIQKTDKTRYVAFYQVWNNTEGREPVKEITLDHYLKILNEGAEPRKIHKEEKIHDGYGREVPPDSIGIWKEHFRGYTHSWKMTIDLTRCIGCGACVIACIEENNIPIVGREEIRRNRDMHWIRIDRYFASDDKNHEEVEGVFQPVMCQHCNNAPCETVCPVAATTSSIEGINMMAYNRCVGTRYCANNCPYKVRRFNWWNYPSDKKFTGINPAQDDYEKFMLNPVVTVRERGVMEKCSFCIQRIQEGKRTAKKERRELRDGEIVPACAEVCPTTAITFGDYNDTNSKVYKEYNSPLSYSLLAELGTRPNVAYLTKIKNIKEENHKKEA